MRALMKAITGNDVAQVYALLQAGVDLNQRYLSDYPLQAAIRTGSLELVQAFLESGVDVNFVYGEPEQRNRKTALIFAVQCKQPEICQFLLAHGADPNYLQTDESRNEDQTPLDIAIQRNLPEVFAILLPHTDLSIGRGLHYEGRHIHLACRAGNLEIVRGLLEAGVDVNLRGGVNELTPLHVAVEQSHPAIVAYLLARGADVHARDRRLNVPLHAAQSREVAQLLITQGAEVNAQNDFGETPLFQQRDPQMVALLLENGAEVNRACNSGETPLHRVLASAEIVALLVAHGADVNAATRKGATPLHYACRDAAPETGVLETVALLIENGAAVNALAAGGVYDGAPLHIAVEAKRDDVCERLLASGADVHAPNNAGDTPLHLAAEGGYTQIARRLLAGGADTTAVNHAGETALDIATSLRHTAIIKLLGGALPSKPAPVSKILPAISLDEYKRDLVIPVGLQPYQEALLDSVQPFIAIHPQPDDALALWESKFGGQPYLPRAHPYPLDGEGKPLFFLAQINFAETPRLDGFPTQGILAFYIYADYVYSLSDDNTRQEKFRVLYFPAVTPDEDALTTDFDFLPLFPYPPIERPLGLRFQLDYAPVSNEDYRFEQQIGRPFYALDAGMTFAEQMAFFKMRYCKLGGYPGTTQDYPIVAETGKDVLLLQISCGEHITWGDGGLANFFIAPEDLARRDFSRVLYNWDCG